MKTIKEKLSVEEAGMIFRFLCEKLAKPIPKFAIGTKPSTEGPAVVGELGPMEKLELLRTDAKCSKL